MSDEKNLDDIIAAFKRKQPTEAQIKKWDAVLGKVRLQPRYYLAAGLAAGLILGLLSGRFLLNADSLSEPNFSATFVQRSVKNL